MISARNFGCLFLSIALVYLSVTVLGELKERNENAFSCGQV